MVIAVCPVGVGSWQVQVDLPAAVALTVGSATGSGFMSNPTSFFNSTAYRWFNLNANGQANGNLTIQVTIPAGLPAGSSFQITWDSASSFKDMGGASMGTNPALPTSVTVNVIYSVTVQMVYQALDAYFSKTVWSPIGRTPILSDIFDLLDIHFAG